MLSDQILQQDIFESGIQFVFALLTKTSFELYEDMHMATAPLAEFSYA